MVEHAGSPEEERAGDVDEEGASWISRVEQALDKAPEQVPADSTDRAAEGDVEDHAGKVRGER